MSFGKLQDSDFAGDLEDSKSTSAGALCIYGSHTFVPLGWMCKKQTCVSHNSTQSEIMSLAASLRKDGIPALDNPNANQKQKLKQSTEKPVNQKSTQCSTQLPQKHSELSNVDFVSSNVNSSHKGAMLYIFEDEAVIKMTIKGRSPTRRHVSKT